MDTNNFFPTENYKIPETSNYLKFKEGETTFRVLSSAIVGWQYFNTDNKPVRSKEPFDEIPADLKKGGRINHFWAFVVYNVEAKKIQVCELTQRSIMAPIEALIKNKKWGDPKQYDITVTRKGTGLQDTEYSVMPNPASPIQTEVIEKYKKANINLQALFEGLDPFATEQE